MKERRIGTFESTYVCTCGHVYVCAVPGSSSRGCDGRGLPERIPTSSGKLREKEVCRNLS